MYVCIFTHDSMLKTLRLFMYVCINVCKNVLYVCMYKYMLDFLVVSPNIDVCNVM